MPETAPVAGGTELYTEWFLPFEHAVEALNELYAIKDTFAHLILVSELRMVAADDIPMSPMKGRECIVIHVSWVHKYDAVMAVLPLVEEKLAKYSMKPHLGKCFAMSGQRFEELYGQELDMLRGLLVRYDPERRFRNDFMDKYLFTNKNGALPEKKCAELAQKMSPHGAKL